MAQDILITPGSGEPQILFRGSGTNDTPIELNVLSSYLSANGSGSALLFEGTEGQLFAITDNLSSGVIFSVADIAGLPLIEADASGDVQLIEYGRYVGVGTGTPAYQLDVVGTGRFSDGIIFPDGNTQTVAYTGQTGDWKVGVSGLTDTITSGETVTFTGAGTSNVFYDDSTNTLTISGQAGAGMTSWNVGVTGATDVITDGETVTFTGLGLSTVTYDVSTNTVYISGSGGGGTTYTADSGIELQDTTFVMGGTGSLDRLFISGQDPNLNVLTITGAPSQSAPITEWYSSDSTPIASILYDGTVSGSNTGLFKFIKSPTVPILYSSVASEAFLAGYNHQNSVGIMIGKECRNDSFGVAIGFEVGFDGTSSKDYMVGIGYQALYRARGPFGAVAIGRLAGASRSTTSTLDGDNSVFIGHTAGYNISDSIPGGSFSNSVIVGAGAGQNGYGGDNSVFVGFQAGDAVSGAHNIAIGHRPLENADGYRNIEIITSGTVSSIIGTNNNKLHIENTIIGDTSSKLIAIGNVSASNLTPDATLEVLPAVSTDIGLIVQGAASHTANLQEWQDSSANILAYVDTEGMISGSGMTYTDGTVATSIFTDVITDGNTGITYSETTFGGKYVRLTNSLDIEVSIPSGLNTYQYTETLFEQAAAGQITVTGQAGVTLNFRSSNTSAGQYSVITLKKVATDTYILFGDVT